MTASAVDDDLFDEAVSEFRYQFREDGYYDSTHDPGWRYGPDDIDVATKVAEYRWSPTHGYGVPSRLWDKGTPSTAIRAWS